MRRILLHARSSCYRGMQDAITLLPSAHVSHRDSDQAIASFRSLQSDHHEVANYIAIAVFHRKDILSLERRHSRAAGKNIKQQIVHVLLRDRIDHSQRVASF